MSLSTVIVPINAAPTARARLLPWREGAARRCRPMWSSPSETAVSTSAPRGVRVEDTVIVRSEGPNILTDFVRKLEM